ncbi:CHAT domain-containing protein [Streptomyces sp. VMFN-G11Ma]|jgi:hypothetical protein|uniref:CHAT domain-containing protein n=1 Tax=Streptomyces sp. VMFN-G11Ma TaxID=2135609 RepID=UPI000D3BF1D4|nr:CHAT domain-containing protein [Streptomyces sp. VMFN-G11Ma]PTM99298.1 CHAT domain-containing protein [Streptomyces sp. VMFN-G11Ma]
MPERQTPPVVEDFRAALHSMQDLNAWLECHDEDLDELGVWARNNDSELLRELPRRPEVRVTFERRAEDAWRNTLSSSRVAFWIAEELLCGGLPPSKSRWVKGILSEGSGVRRLAVYSDLTDMLRPIYGTGHAKEGIQRGGWVYLLADAGKSAFALKRPEVAVPLYDEAWKARRALRPGTPATAKAIARVAIQYAMAIGYLSDSDATIGFFDIALDRFQESRSLLLSHVPNPELASEFLEIAIGTDEIWRNRRKRRHVGLLTSAEHRLQAFHVAEADLWAATGRASSAVKPGDYDYASLPKDERPKAARYLLNTAGAAEDAGDFDVALICARKALTLSERSSDRLKSRLALIRLERDRTAMIASYEQLLRDLVFGDENSPAQHSDTIRKQLSDAAGEMSKVLARLERPTASWFWSRLSKDLRSRFPREAPSAGQGDRDSNTPPAPDIAEAESSGPVRATGRAGPSSPAPSHQADEGWEQRLADRVHTEHTHGLVLTLLGLANRHPQEVPPTSSLLERLAVVDRWRPARRGTRASRLPVEQCRSGTDVVRVCTEIADEFAQGYAPLYRPELLIRLLENGGLAPEQRHVVAEETYQVGLEAGRPRESIKALLELIRLRHQSARPDPARKINDLAAAACDLIQGSLETAHGTADLIDIAQSLTAVSNQLAGLLALQGHEEWAFKAAHAPIGALSRAFAENPDLIQEYELAEQRQHRGTPDASQQLFAMMLDRLRTGGESHRSKASPKLADVAAPFGSPVTIVQLLRSPQYGAWALGADLTNGDCRYWSCRIEVTPSLLNILREAIEAWTGSQHGQDYLLEDLRRLHATVVHPWIGRITEGAAVVFIPHRAFSGLPLHAALGPDGHLVEHHRVGYLPNFESPPSGASRPQTAFIGGWDNAIKAVDEVRVLTPQVEDEFGFDVVSPHQATDARECLLGHTAEWGIVHIVAHGEFYRWPLSSTSKLRLLDGVTVSASEWLHSGCGASLIFLNACTVGRQAPHAGDLNGFPLALRVRGAVAEVSCLTPVAASAAYEFAVTFYSKFVSHDTLTAYQSACQDAISQEKPPRNWIPYLHVGFPVSLNTPRGMPA